ncbi:pilus assembly protein TadG-related protein [Dongia deserti]|uniref:pilus assembly protein TadG-related protein n=1 Tax=Dongia deserti TaxID=2268030 RepID=UPI000E65266E|nr:pilus assembly protein TadG-related protein [Dongia deserti]
MGISSGRIGIIGFGRRLGRDERGAVLIYVSLALTVFMGFAALVIDGGRLFTLDTEMQSAADALALAGAAELDGNGDAITRATQAMANLVDNNPTFSSNTSKITVSTPIFLKSLPSDDTPISVVESSTHTTTDPIEARFVLVKLTDANSRSIDTLFAPAIGGGTTAPANAVAIAGFTSAVCKFTPLFICNPYPDEQALLDKLDDWNDPDNADRRRLINLKKWSGNGQLSPGNFGFLDTPGQNGAAALRDALAVDEPLACFSQDGVDLHQGNVASVRQGINTRFDLYDGNFNSKKNNEAYRPAVNVVKGYTLQNGGACTNNNQLDPTNARPLPLDENWTQLAGTAGSRWGLGDWDCASYWAWNHGPDHTAAGDPAAPSGCSTAANTTMSRYDMYRSEVDNSRIPNTSNLSPKGENGNPQCYKNGNQNNTLSDPSRNPDDIDRRIIYAAVLDCSALPNGNSQTEMPALAFVKMFVTRPMAKNSNNCNGNGNFDPNCEEDANDLFIEIIDKVKPGSDDAVLHDIVQLYR